MNMAIQTKSAGESLSNKFVSIIFCTTKGATRLYTVPFGSRTNDAISRNDVIHRSRLPILDCVHLYITIFLRFISSLSRRLGRAARPRTLYFFRLKECSRKSAVPLCGTPSSFRSLRSVWSASAPPPKKILSPNEPQFLIVLGIFSERTNLSIAQSVIVIP